MRIGLITDTHIPEARPDLPPEVFVAFSQVDLVLHAGDMYTVDVLDWLEKGVGVPVVAVRGNGDGRSDHPAFPADDPRVKDAQVLELEGVRVGMVHALADPDEVRAHHFEAAVRQTFGPEALDVLVLGDTHIPHVGRYGEMLVVNSGSPTVHDLRKRLGTVALLTIDGGQASCDVVELSTI